MDEVYCARQGEDKGEGAEGADEVYCTTRCAQRRAESHRVTNLSRCWCCPGVWLFIIAYVIGQSLLQIRDICQILDVCQY